MSSVGDAVCFASFEAGKLLLSFEASKSPPSLTEIAPPSLTAETAPPPFTDLAPPSFIETAFPSLAETIPPPLKAETEIPLSLISNADTFRIRNCTSTPTQPTQKRLKELECNTSPPYAMKDARKN